MADDKNKSIDDVLSESEAAEAHAEWEHDIRRHFKPLGELGADWLTAPPPPRRSLLTVDGKPFIPLGKVGLVAGPGGIGKTQFLTQLAVSVATGKPLLKDYEVEDCGKVLLALGEEDADEMRRRIYYTGQSLELTQRERTALEASLYPLPLCGRDVQLLRSLGKHADDRLLESNFCLGLREVLEQHAGPNGWRCIILDPASRFMGSDTETDNHAATQFIQCLERLTETAGTPTVLVGHHTRKGSGGQATQDEVRGASALVDGARWVAQLKQETKDGNENLMLRVTKTNYTRGGKLSLAWSGSGVLLKGQSSPSTVAV